MKNSGHEQKRTVILGACHDRGDSSNFTVGFGVPEEVTILVSLQVNSRLNTFSNCGRNTLFGLGNFLWQRGILVTNTGVYEGIEQVNQNTSNCSNNCEENNNTLHKGIIPTNNPAIKSIG